MTQPMKCDIASSAMFPPFESTRVKTIIQSLATHGRNVSGENKCEGSHVLHATAEIAIRFGPSLTSSPDIALQPSMLGSYFDIVQT